MGTPTVTLSALTEARKGGLGVFDKLMTATEAHLNDQYDKDRIKGPAYAEVYLGSMTAVLQQSVQFLLAKEKATLEADLIAAQIAKVSADIAKVDAEIALANSQLLKLDAEIALLEGQNLLVGKQGEKIDAEIAILNQKKLTEAAQISGAGVDVDSMIGRQKALYAAQTDGFQRNAEQSVGKLMLDTWNVRRTTNDATFADNTNYLNDTNLGNVVAKLMEGIGVTADGTP